MAEIFVGKKSQSWWARRGEAEAGPSAALPVGARADGAAASPSLLHASRPRARTPSSAGSAAAPCRIQPCADAVLLRALTPRMREMLPPELVDPAFALLSPDERARIQAAMAG